MASHAVTQMALSVVIARRLGTSAAERFNVISLRVLRDSVVKVSYKKAQKNTAPGGTGAAGFDVRYYQAK